MSEILDLKYEKYTLPNGLEIVLHQNRSLPLAAVNLWYKVGSANETKGKTGFAHLFEHMMFQGSENVPKEMHFRYIQEAGGTLNGSTSLDRTNYYETVPSNNLELALWLESDRMGYFLSALTEEKLRNQKDVVMNERRQRYDNQPYGRAWEMLFSNLYPEEFPYHWPTIGWMEDIEKFELNEVKSFFEKFYVPNNASMVIAGDIEISHAKELAEKYFAGIPSGLNQSISASAPPMLNSIKEITLEDDIELSRLYLAWISDKLYAEDDAVLDIISDLLSGGKNSRLYKHLVYDKQIAQDISCFQYSANLSGTFFIVCTAKPGISLNKIKKEIFSVLDAFTSSECTDREIQRAKNNYKSSFVFSLQNIEMVADHLNNYNCQLGNPNSFLYDLGRYDTINAEMIKLTAQKYLRNPYVQLSIIPKKGNL